MSTLISSRNKKLLRTLPKVGRPPLLIHSAIAKSIPPALLTAKANKILLYVKQKYPLTTLPNYIMNPVLQISGRDLVITRIHLPAEIKEIQASYQKKFGERRIMVLSHQ